MKVRHVLLSVVVFGGALLGAACTTGGDEATVEAGPGQVPSPGGTADDTADETGPSDTSTTRSTAHPYVEALAAGLRALSEYGDGFTFTDDQITCFAPRVVAIYDVDRLEDEGITPDELDASGMGFLGLVIEEAEANAVWDTYAACDIDIRAMFIEAMAGPDASPEMLQCLADRVTDDLLRNAQVETMISAYDEDAPRDDPGDLFRTVMSCAQQ